MFDDKVESKMFKRQRRWAALRL